MGKRCRSAANIALFSLLGTQYGGNGTTNFALPDLRGRTLIGAGLSGGIDYLVGGTFGDDLTTLTVANLPAHDHSLPAAPEPAAWSLLGLGLAGTLAARRVTRRR